ncbi:MAG: hypothetical protein AAB250_02490, partial [Bdellovibrionota bacterium]
DGSKYPDWSLSNNLDGILLHEVGHVHGVGHVSGTIMDADIAHGLSRQAGYGTTGMGTIDVFVELVVCMKCDQTREGMLGIKQGSTTTTPDGQVTKKEFDTEKEMFTRLTGRAPVGKVSARVVGTMAKSLKLVVVDEKGESEFEVALVPGSMSVDKGTGVFKRFKSTEKGVALVSWAGHNSSSQMATITSATGEKLAVSVLSNQSAATSEIGDGLMMPMRFGLVLHEATGSKVLFAEFIKL